MRLSLSLLLLAIIRMCMVLRKQDASSAEQMSRGLGKLSNGAQIFLFVLRMQAW